MEPKILQIGPEEFYQNFWSDDCVFPLHTFYQKYEEHKAVVKTGWKKNGGQTSMHIKSVCPVKGVPFCDETTCNKTIKVVENSPCKLVLEMDSKTVEAPYSDTFYVQEAWLVLSTEALCEKKSIFIRLAFINFVKYTLFKGTITDKAVPGIKDAAKLWHATVDKLGHLKTKKKAPPVEPEKKVEDKPVEEKEQAPVE